MSALVSHGGPLAYGAAIIVHIEHKRAHNLLHDQIGYLQIFNDTATTALGFDAQTTVWFEESAVADNHISDVSARLAVDYNTTVTLQKMAIENDDTFTGFLLWRMLRSGLNGDTVVTHVNRAVEDMHIFATVGIDTVGILGVRGIENAGHGRPRHGNGWGAASNWGS